MLRTMDNPGHSSYGRRSIRPRPTSRSLWVGDSHKNNPSYGLTRGGLRQGPRVARRAEVPPEEEAWVPQEKNLRMPYMTLKHTGLQDVEGVSCSPYDPPHCDYFTRYEHKGQFTHRAIQTHEGNPDSWRAFHGYGNIGATLKSIPFPLLMIGGVLGATLLYGYLDQKGYV